MGQSRYPVAVTMRYAVSASLTSYILTVRCPRLTWGMSLRNCYAMSGTDKRRRELQSAEREREREREEEEEGLGERPMAREGGELRYAPTRALRDAQY
eukprot:3462497-Rhodomonas_salina.2